MKKIGFFILFLPVMVDYESKGNAFDTSQALKVFMATKVDLGINNLDHSQVLILLLVGLIFVLLFGLAVFLIVWRLIRIGHAYRELVNSNWNDEPHNRWRKVGESDLSLGMFTEQQWLLDQLFWQNHEDGGAHDFVDLPHNW